ncbi:TerB family tellurite resistance protein [Paracoccus sp. 11-3]|uniref:TerB family tellurite resistance protein n=1 Tax=Paracoccus amoyensis TaxID=2760093 RepID=A0A926GF34_9RHOB|nr:TerB family tellurite resistance protein [Paracoccus amoyensis]MBC9247127.1 TerB family tellurite resistance protein [Paracoccus amoyensis]
MFRNLLSRLFTEEPNPARLATQDAEVAIAALMVRLARADDRYSRAEQERIDHVLARRCGLDLQEAAERRAAAEMIEAEAPDTVRFTRHIKDRIALEDRIGVISALWEVAYADQKRSSDEETLVRLVSGLLGVTDRDSAIVRQRVREDLGLEPIGRTA